MTPHETPPPGKVPLTPQYARFHAILGAALTIFFVCLATYNLHHGLNLKALFWAASALLGLAASVESLLRLQKILRGAPVFVSAPLATQIGRAGMTIYVVLALVCLLAYTVYILAVSRQSGQLHGPKMYALLIFFWSLGAALYGFAHAKGGLLWTRSRSNMGPNADDLMSGLPPMTTRGLLVPALKVFGFGMFLSWLEAANFFYVHGRDSIANILIGIVGGIIIGSLFSLIYIALVAFLTRLNHRQERLLNPISTCADEDVWPPPPISEKHEETPS